MFQQIAASAAAAAYVRNDFLSSDDNHRIATAAVNRGAQFSEVMAQAGHVHDI